MKEVNQIYTSISLESGWKDETYKKLQETPKTFATR